MKNTENRIQDYIAAVVKNSSFEMLIAPMAEVRFKLKNQWQNINSEKLTAQNCKDLLLPMLTKSNLVNLEEKKFTDGFWQISGQSIYFQMQSTEGGLQAQLSWIPQEIKSASFWNFPIWTKESLSRGQGLHILIAKNNLTIEAAAISYIENINHAQSKFIVWNKADTLAKLKSENSVISYYAGEQIPLHADLVVLEGFANCDKAFACAERGQSVLLLLNHAEKMTRALQKISGEKLAEHMKWAMSLKLIQGPQGWTSVFDLLANTSQVQEVLKSQKLSELDKWMSENSKEGMRTMNQSLLQLILKRKIDLKQGFEESLEPENLDELLKKVGF